MEALVLVVIALAVLYLPAPFVAWAALRRANTAQEELERLRQQIVVQERIRRAQERALSASDATEDALEEQRGVPQPDEDEAEVVASSATFSTAPPPMAPVASMRASSDAVEDVEEAAQVARDAVEDVKEAVEDAKEAAAAVVEPASGTVEGDAKEAYQERENEASSAMDFETLLGTKWLLRIGLGILAIALALFAGNVVPQLPAIAKVLLAYASAIGLFTAGKLLEDKLRGFARPVMAGGLAFGFFVAFAAHFVPAMQAISLPFSLAWMVASMLSVLLMAERWESETTAGLAILLGHLSAFVATTDAATYSLVLIGFLALTAIVLLLRHSWVQLGVFAAVLSYGSHLLWMLADRAPAEGNTFWLSLAFLTSYYVLFLIADVLWWRRRSEDGVDEVMPAEHVSARALGPTNLVLYASLASFVFVVAEADISQVAWFFFTIGSVQGALAWFYRDVNHRDFVFYPAFGTVLWTLGLFAWLDALVLNLVLASEALILLMAAHRTRLWVFHALAQLALLVAFVHYLAYPHTESVTLAAFIGGLGVVAVYLLKASLEEIWYGEGDVAEWESGLTDGTISARLVAVFSDVFAPIAPRLAMLHAGFAGFILVREAREYWQNDLSLVLFVGLAQLAVVALTLGRGRFALLVTHTVVAAASIFLVSEIDDPIHSLVLLAALTLAALSAIHVATDRLPERDGSDALLLAQGTVAMALVGAVLVLTGNQLAFADYLPWMALPFLIFVFQERARPLYESFAVGEQLDDPVHPATFGIFFSAIASLLVIGLTALSVGFVVTAPVWIAGWSIVLLGVGIGRGSRALLVAGALLLFVGDYVFLLSEMNLTSDVLSNLWVGLIVTAVPLAFALTFDHATDSASDQLTDSDRRWGAPAAYAAYATAFLLLGALAHFQLPLGWAVVVPTVFGVFLIEMSDRLGTPKSLAAVVVGVMVLNLSVLWSLTRGTDLSGALLVLGLFAVATLVVERAVVRRGWGEEPTEARTIGRIALVVAAVVTAMTGIYESSLFGARWVTAGWSGLAVLLIAVGFAWKAASHRRIGLLILGICLVRVFAVDIRGLSGTVQTLVMLVLGLSLVGVALLYNKFADELKSWL